MNSYSHPAIQLNGRSLLLESIIDGTAVPRTTHEESVISFVKDWVGGRSEFEFQTSGSTGTPKRITITRHQMIASAKLTADALGLKSGDVALTCIDTHYIGGKMMLVRSLVCDMKMVVVDPVSNPLEIPGDIPCVDFTAFVPLQIKTILSSTSAAKLNDIKCIIIGGAPLSEHEVIMLDNFSAACYLTYGMTETISHIALRRLNGSNKQPYFKTLSTITVDVDTRGCLVANVPYLSGPLQTNDIIERLSDRLFLWKGRWDNVINSGGVKVMVERVEERLLPVFLKHNITNRFFVTGLKDDHLGERVAVVIESASVPDVSFLRNSVAEINATFPRYEAPRSFEFVKSFTLTDTGKINRVKTLELIYFSLPLRSIADSR